MKNIIIQAIGVMGTIIYFLSFQCKKNRNLFLVQFISYFFYIAHLFLIGALTGCISYSINMMRSYFLASDNKLFRSNYTCLFLCILQILTIIFTYQNIFSFLPPLANIATTIAGYTHNPKKIRTIGMLFNSPLWIIYDISIGSVAGLIDEVACNTSIIISLIRFKFKDKKESEIYNNEKEN